MKDYYKILGIKRDASQKEIKNAYRHLAKKHHPDATGKKTDEQFKNIQEAYSTLSDPEKRSDYDACLGESVRVRVRTSVSNKVRYQKRGGFSVEPLIPRDSNQPASFSDPFSNRFSDEFDDLFDRLRAYLFRRFFSDDEDFFF